MQKDLEASAINAAPTSAHDARPSAEEVQGLKESVGLAQIKLREVERELSHKDELLRDTLLSVESSKHLAADREEYYRQREVETQSVISSLRAEVSRRESDYKALADVLSSSQSQAASAQSAQLMLATATAKVSELERALAEATQLHATTLEKHRQVVQEQRETMERDKAAAEAKELELQRDISKLSSDLTTARQDILIKERQLEEMKEAHRLQIARVELDSREREERAVQEGRSREAELRRVAQAELEKALQDERRKGIQERCVTV